MTDRMTKLRALLPGKDAPGIEIAPAHNPVCPKAEGWNVTTIDKISTQELTDYLALDPENNVTEVQPIDLVWRTGALHESIDPVLHGKFRYIVASHVFEHMPDLIGFLHSVEKLLASDGLLLLVLPDRRYTLDYFRPFTTAADIIDAYQRPEEHHTLRNAYQNYFYSACIGSIYAWTEARHPDRFRYTFEEAKQKLADYPAESARRYVDMHKWIFTPSSFKLSLMELQLLDYIKMQIAHFEQPNINEFVAVLKTGTIDKSNIEAIDQERLELAMNAVLEYSAVYQPPQKEKIPLVSPFMHIDWPVRKIRLKNHWHEVVNNGKCIANQVKTIVKVALRKL